MQIPLSNVQLRKLSTTEAVVNTPAPKNTTQQRALLGLVNFYHKFLPNIGTEIRPLNELLEKDRNSNGYGMNVVIVHLY
jgi:hypothetical protein